MNKWKEASTLIISAACKNQTFQKSSIKNIEELDKCNFDILSLKKRGCGSTGQPRMCVFPGGTFSAADSVKEWETLFTNFGVNPSLFPNSIRINNAPNFPILDNKQEELPRWLSLRITAIRETFEECGILLCKKNQVDEHTSKEDHSTSHFEIDNIDSWRSKVLSDPFQFIALCKTFSCYPDVQNLHLWSNWLTPSHLPERFDAIFFLTFMDNLKDFRGTPDYKEIASVQWLKPEKLLGLSSRSEIWLKPPQWYEINTLCNIKDVQRLKTFCHEKVSKCSQWMPVRVMTTDGEISLLPGDEMYPREVDLYKRTPISRPDNTMESLRCERMHRMEHSGVRITLLDTRSER